VLSRRSRFPYSVKDGRALDNNGRFLVAWKMCDWRLVDTTSSIDIDGIYDFVGSLATFCRPRILTLILPSWREQKATIRGKRQPPEKRSERLIGVKVDVF
jgi:hypothetical protein